MQEVKIDCNVVAIDSKTFICRNAANDTEALFFEGKPLAAKIAGKVYLDGEGWRSSKSAKMRLRAYLGIDGEAIVEKVLSGEYERVTLVAPSVEMKPIRVNKAAAEVVA